MRRLALLTLVAAFVIGGACEAQAGLFDFLHLKKSSKKKGFLSVMFRGGADADHATGGNCCRPTKCCAPAPTCRAPAPTCCAPAPTCCAPAPTCCAPAPTCCGSAPPSSAKPYEETPPLPKKDSKPAPKKSASKGDIKPAPKKPKKKG